MRCTTPTLFLALATQLACAKIGLGEPHVASSDVATRIDVVKRAGPASATVDQHTTFLTLRATRECVLDKVKVRTVESVTERDRHNTTPQYDWYLVGGAALSLGFGITMVATPSSFQSKDETGAVTGWSKEGVQGAGGTLIGVGAGLLVIVVIDLLRSVGAEESVSRKEMREAVQRDVPCPAQPYGGAHFAAVVPGEGKVGLGLANDKGVLEVDLLSAVTRSADLRAEHASIAVVLDGDTVGQADLRPVARHYEEEAWRGAGPMLGLGAAHDADQCAADPVAEKCKPVLKFLERFPYGRHAEAARTASQPYTDFQSKQEAAARKRADDDEWSSANPAACRAKQTDDACSAVAAYRYWRPDGAHVAEANALVEARAKAERAREEAARRAAQDELAQRQAQATAAAKHAECFHACSSACRGQASTCQTKCLAEKCK